MAKKFKKTSVIENLINPPQAGLSALEQKNFWKREMKIFNDLMKKFPDESFWLNLNFHKKYNSLGFFKHEIGAKLLKRKYGHYKYQIPEAEKLKIHDKSFGENTKYTKQKKINKGSF